MYIYFICIFFAVTISYFIKEKYEIGYSGYKIKKKLIINNTRYITIVLKTCCMLLPIAVSALRYEVGTDYTATYYDGFVRVNTVGNAHDQFDIGYQFLNILLYQISTNPQIVFIVTSVLFGIFTFKAIYNSSTDIMFSVFLLFGTRYYFISMNVVRQFVAMAMVLYATKYIFTREYKKYVCFVIIAGLIHYMVLLSLLFLVLPKIRLNQKKFISSFFIMFALFVLAQLHIIESVVQKLLGGTRYAHHFENAGLFSGEKFTAFTFTLNLILLIIFFINYKQRKNDKRYMLYINAQLITTMLCTLMTSVHLIERVYYIFGFMQILSIPYMINLYKFKDVRMTLKIGTVIFFSAYCYWDIFMKFDHQVVPYKSIFEMNS